MKQLLNKAKIAESELQEVFEDQDELSHEIKIVKDRINILEEKNIKLVDEKKSLKEYSQKGEPDPSVTVNKEITMDTFIKGVASSITLSEDLKRVKIEEVIVKEDGRQYYEMKISNLTT